MLDKIDKFKIWKAIPPKTMESIKTGEFIIQKVKAFPDIPMRCTLLKSNQDNFSFSP